MALFHQNAVLTGVLDSYCLLCEVHLRQEEEIRSHIAEHQHEENLRSTDYLEKYKVDKIRKVKQGYYCAYCNKFFATIMKVRMHVSGEIHRKNKDLTQLKLQGNIVVAFDKIALDEDAWHGLVDGSCTICNTEYEDKQIHKTTPAHILKLVQSCVELDSNGEIYRKGDDFFFCLVCNALFSQNILKTHFDSPDHVKFYNKCRESYTNLPNHENIKVIPIKEFARSSENIEGNENNVKSTSPPATDNKSVSKTELHKSEENNSEVKVPQTITKEPFKGKENQIKSAGNQLGVSGNIKEVEDNSINTDENETDNNGEGEASAPINIKKANRLEKAKKFAEENKFKQNDGGSSVYCSICNVTISGSLKRMKEHVADISHQKNAKAVNKIVLNVKPMGEFIKEIFFIRTFLNIYVVINGSICITHLSFSLMTNHHTHIRCQVCEVNVNISLYDEHRNSGSHRSALDKTSVLLSPISEFVREVRPGLYHCGFCNIIEGSWRGMTDHFKSINHKEKKNLASRRLREHLPDIQEHKQKLLFIRLFDMFH